MYGNIYVVYKYHMDSMFATLNITTVAWMLVSSVATSVYVTSESRVIRAACIVVLAISSSMILLTHSS